MMVSIQYLVVLITNQIKFTFRLLFIIINLLYLATFCSAQEWHRVYNYEYPVYVKNLQETYDKGYLLGGSHLLNVNTLHFGLIIKTDINGNKLWEKRYGDVVESTYFTHMEKTSDGGAIFSGATTENDVNYNPLFLKVNACFEIEWCKIILSPGYDDGSFVRVLPDGSYIGMMRYYDINGQETRISLVKFHVTGEPEWIQSLLQEDTTINNAEGYHLLVTSDTNFLVSGDDGGPSPLFVLADSAGAQEWEMKWKEDQYIWGGGFCTVEKDPGIFYSAGTRFCGRSSPAPAIFKFNNAGHQLDDFCLLSDTIYYGWALPICVFNDSTLVVGIEWENFTYEEGFSEVFLIDTVGIIKNRRLLLDEQRSPDDIIITFDGKILVGGTYSTSSSFDIHLFKLNENLQDDSLYSFPLNYDTLCSYQIPSDTIDLDCGIFTRINEIPAKKDYDSRIIISPNPARDWIMMTLPDILSAGTVELEVYNIFGQPVMRKKVVPSDRMFSVDLSSLSSGLYNAVCRDRGNRIFRGKFLVAR